ncbi:unnamed protein product [Eruca vesicaria subsp. sativa]|uniref:Uncharacterized protein n=1 Tax=Eruca vesicaria subsp. sativa TaxID=29727 RepID=A0ABC8M5V7_ERUVS|nr:unnamed protein product [Eruca vesicaria subsp. sativa]
MANDELVKPENPPLSFRQDHFTGIRHNFELFPTHDYNSAFEQLLDINLQIGVPYEENEVWNQFQEHKAMALHPNDETEEEAVLVASSVCFRCQQSLQLHLFLLLASQVSRTLVSQLVFGSKI